MNVFWEGVLAGYGIAIPVGAIAILIVDTGLRRGFVNGFMAGTGAATADLFYASLAAIAGEALASLLAPLSVPLRAASALLLLTLGIHGLLRAGKAEDTQGGAPSHSEEELNRFATFVRFLGLTLLNPMTIAYFAALILGRETGSDNGIIQRLAFVVGAGLASWTWQTFLAGTGAIAGRRMSPGVRRATTIVGNLIVLGFGLRIAIEFLAG